MESFDPKPELTKYAGKTIDETPYKDVQNPEKLKLARVTVVNDANGQQRNKLYPAAGRLPEIRPERHRGERLAAAHRRAASTTSPSSARCTRPTTITGRRRSFTPAGTCSTASFPRSAPGCTTGSGSLNDNLPQFISMGKREYWNAKDGHYLGPAHDAVPIRVDPEQSARLRQARAATSAPRSSRSASTSSAG